VRTTDPNDNTVGAIEVIAESHGDVATDAVSGHNA
jgi:hypothetical protein